MLRCPDDATLDAMATRRAADDVDTRNLRAHVDGCADCRARVSVLLQHQTLSTDRLEGTPAAPARGDDRFRIESEFAHGGLGAVYRARDERLGRVVAVKQLLLHSPDAAARFRREALITARLQHPAIVPVYEAGTFPSGEPFYAMRLVAGRPLRLLVDEARTLDRRLALLPHLITVAEAVAYAHSQGVIHRDLKPANVIVGDFGETVVIDWGLAKQLHDADSPAAQAAGGGDDSTQVGAVMGTPQYMPPEQARGLPVDTRADVYALGAMLYHLLVGAPPYRGSSQEVLQTVIDTPPPAIESLQRGVPADLSAIARKAMARDAGERYRDAGAFAADLRRFVSGQLVRAHAYSRGALVWRWLARHRVPVTLTSIFLAALLAGGVVAVRRIVRERDRATARGNQLILAGARASLDRDPTATLAWLKTYPLDGQDWDQARSLALEALGSGAAADIYWPVEGPSYGALSPDGKQLAHQNGAKAIEVTEIETGRVLQSIPVDRYVWALHWSPDGRRLMGDGDLVEAWDLPSGAAHPTQAGTSEGLEPLDPAGTRAAYLDVDQHALRIVDFSDGTTRLAAALPEPGLCLHVDRRRQRLFTATRGGALVFYDLATGARRELHADGVLDGCLLSDDGRVLISFGDTLQQWDVESGRATTLRPKGVFVRAVRFSAGGELLFAGDEQGHIVVYDRARGAAVGTLDGHTRTVNSLELGDGGAHLVSSGRDGTVRVWDPRSGDSVVLRGHASQAVAASLTADGRHALSVSADASLRVWRVPRDGLDALRAHPGEIRDLVVLDDDRVVTMGFDEGLARLTDFRARTVTTIAGHSGRGDQLAISPDRRRVASLGSDGVVNVWRRESGLLRRLRVDGEPLNAVAFGCDDDTLVTTSIKARPVRLWSLQSGSSRQLADIGGDGMKVVFSRDCRLLAVQGADHQLRVYDLVSGAAPRTYAGMTNWTSALALAPDGSRLAAAGYDGTLRIWELPAGRAFVVPHGGPIFDMVQSPDGWTVASGDFKGQVRLTDLRDGRSRLLTGHTGFVPGVAFSPDGKWIASGSADRTLRLWDVATGAQLAAVHAGDTITRVAFLSDGKRIVTADNTGMVRLWRATPMGPATHDPATLRSWLLTTTNVVLRGDGALASP